MRTINQAGLDIIKEFEGLRLKAYLCPAGVWTVGYGHTSAAGAPTVYPETTVTAAEAEAILRADLRRFEEQVAAMVKVPVTDNQFSALVSLAFNIGVGALGSSTLMRKLNARDVAGARAEFARWNKAGGKVLRGLTRRRAAEAELFGRP